MKTLIIFHSKYGQTRKIVERIASHLSVEGSSFVQTIEVGSLNPGLTLQDYDAVIVGAPIYATRHSKDVASFVRTHLEELKTKQTGFFSVSLSASGTESQRNDAQTCMDQFLASCNWTPTRKTIIAGGLPYRKYGWFTRFMMKRIVRKSGGDVDTTREYEYTQWNEVEQFADQFKEALCATQDLPTGTSF